jgi:hypothetical protein
MSPIRKCLCGFVLAVAIAATVVPSASAITGEQFIPSTGQKPKQGPPVEPHSSTSTAITVSGDNGFDWGDAGVGAGGALALGMVAVGGALVLRNRHGQVPPPMT